MNLQLIKSVVTKIFAALFALLIGNILAQYGSVNPLWFIFPLMVIGAFNVLAIRVSIKKVGAAFKIRIWSMNFGQGFAFDSLLITDQSWSGPEASFWVVPRLYGLTTIRKGLCYVQDGIKKQITIPRLSFSGSLQPRNETPTDLAGSSKFNVDGRVINPQDIMSYKLVNPRDFESHFEAENLSETLLARQLPVSVGSYMLWLFLGRAFEGFEQGFWKGSRQYFGNSAVVNTDARFQYQFFDGFLCRIIGNNTTGTGASTQAGDGNVYQTTGPVALTSSNIGDALEDLYNAVASRYPALLAEEESYTRMKFIVSMPTQLLYQQFLTTQTFKNQNTTEKGIFQYKGFAVETAIGMPDNTIVFTEAVNSNDGNLFVGMNSQSDENVEFAKMPAGDERYYMKLLFKMDVNYAWSEKMFVYTTLTKSDFSA